MNNIFRKIIFFQMTGGLGNNIIQYFCKYSHKQRVIFLNYNKELSKIFNQKEFEFLYNNKILLKVFNLINILIYKFKDVKKDMDNRNFNLFGLEFIYDQYNMDNLIKFRNKVSFNIDYHLSILRKYNLRNKSYIAVHIRGTDFKEYGIDSFGFDVTIPLEYYRNTINKLKLEDKNNMEILICTDDVNRVKNSNLFIDCIIEERDAISDFIILLNSKILITANSTNSISAAILSKTLDQVFIPKYQFGQNKKQYIPIVENDKLIEIFEDKLHLVE